MKQRSTITRLTRRQALTLLGVGSAALSAVRCGETATGPTPIADTATPVGTSGAACVVSPSETIGPYPSLTDLLRSDIREGKSGVPLNLTITVVNVNNGCSVVAGANVDVWQCDADGHYSEYAQPGYNGQGQTYLRGIQVTDTGGRVTFTTVYPGWYMGRATHIHVEVTINGRSVKVTQIAFPETVSAAVYGTGVYAAHGQNPTTNASDNVFADGVASELATVVGDPTTGYTATFTVGVAL
jgi:protocatechuate 3,4-dioxygenase beta subunit